MLVSSWMTLDPPVATLATNVDEAYEMLLGRRVRVLPLTDETGRLLGVVNERDVLRNASHPQRSLGRCISPRVLRRAVRTVSAGDTIEVAARIFCEDGRLEALPVVDHDRVAGILTRRAAMQALGIEHGCRPHRGSVGEPVARRERDAVSDPRSYPPPPPCIYQG